LLGLLVRLLGSGRIFAVKKFALACLKLLARPVYSGIGTILCLHRVVPAAQVSLLAANRNLEITPEALDALLNHIRKQHYEIIPIDEVPAAIRKPPRRKFIVFTFDDGYLDTLTCALPVFRSHNAPFAVNITTGLIDHNILVWWHLLEHLFGHLDTLRYNDGSHKHELPLGSLEEKNLAFSQLFQHIRSCSDRTTLDAFILSLFAGTGLEPWALSNAYMMNWSNVRELASDNLVTIGAHTVRHLALSRLDPDQLRSEFLEAKTRLEAELKRPVRHMAYPFGDPETVGAREFATARDCGFTTAVTTRSTNIFRQHGGHLHSLPRINAGGDYQIIAAFSASESGFRPARQYRLRRVIV
jgi:peptidoglycan/xylan/chitin deacetylase (PgdA/CDA1 family)